MAYDVFISFKNTAPGGGLTLDRTIAERLHIMLRDEGLNVFFSEKDLSTSAFMDEIYQALDEADLLILVGTSTEYINSRWVKSEWSTFFGSIQSGRKPHGDIITVLNGISTRDLPIQLEHFESFNARDLDGAVDFAFKTLGRVKKSEAAARIAEEQERRRREAEEAAVLEMQRRMEAEKAAELEKQRQEAEKARQERMRKAAEARVLKEQQRRKDAEVRAARSEQKMNKQTGQNRLLKVVTAVVCAALVIGGVFGISAYSKAKREVEEAREAARIAEMNRELAKKYEFTLLNDGYEITKYLGESTVVTLPNQYNGVPVLSVGDRAFCLCKNLESITIPDSVISIGDQAFAHCDNLKSIILPNSVNSIGDSVFSYCYNLASITIPESINSIGDSVFYGCRSLESISIPDGISYVSNELFMNCSNLRSIFFPDSVKTIGNSAFEQCISLEKIKIPDSVTEIGRSAFSGCDNLKSLYLPDGLTSINDWAISGCNSLTSINIPNSVRSIGSCAFIWCYNLSSITIPESVRRIGDDAFEFCTITVTAPLDADYYGYKPNSGVTWIVE